MYDDCDNWPFGGVGYGYGYPARQRLVGFGYDPHCYIATAALAPSPYTTQQLIIARLGGLNKLIEACDDSQPPTGSLNPNNPPNNPAYLTYQAVIQNVVTEINGYLSSVYPCPLAQTGTVCIIQVTGLSTDGLNSITSVDVIEPGNYLVAPAANQFPAYMCYTDPLAQERLWANIYGTQSELCEAGTGANFTVAYTAGNYSDESGQTIQTQSVAIAPAIVSGGQNYQLNDLLVLTGGQSVVPAKVRQAALDLICHSLYQRRLAPEEKNIFDSMAKMWRQFFIEIGEGTKELDGTFKRFYSAGQSWNQRSVLFGANSL